MKKINVKKALLMAASYVVVISLTIAGVYALLADTDSDVNVMTMGNVSIVQNEWQRAEGVPSNATASKAEGSLVDFVQGQKLLPAVFENGYNQIEAYTIPAHNNTHCFHMGDYITDSEAGIPLWFDDRLNNQLDKIITVTNTGNNDCYFRTIFAFECPEGMTVNHRNNDPDANIIINTYGGWLTEPTTPYDYKEIGYQVIDGVRYYVVSAVYGDNLARLNYGILGPGETSRPSLLQVSMNCDMTNEDVAKIGETYDILVLSQAVQIDGFEEGTAEKYPALYALDTAFGEVTLDKALEWFKK